jgi:hypothetical protein
LLNGLTQCREVLAFPLIISGPGVPTGTRIDEPVSLIDAQHPEIARLLLDHLERFMDSGTEPHWAPELTDADKKLLESLGYLQ